MWKLAGKHSVASLCNGHIWWNSRVVINTKTIFCESINQKIVPMNLTTQLLSLTLSPRWIPRLQTKTSDTIDHNVWATFWHWALKYSDGMDSGRFFRVLRRLISHISIGSIWIPLGILISVQRKVLELMLPQFHGNVTTPN